MPDATLKSAVDSLRAGRVIALPTETVYGLAADATNAAAVARIFALKGRPSTNPLIVHVADVVRAKRFAAVWPDAADRLAEAFWPGPLTIVVEKSPLAVGAVTAGGPTVALRVPDHALTLAVLAAFDGGVAAPSANRSNHVSPTTAGHVREEFGDAVEVLDGGPCRVGIESTVVDLTGDTWRVLRPGMIGADAIARVLESETTGAEIDATARAVDFPTLEESTARAVASASPASPLKSPGQLAVHYAPRTPAFRFAPHERPLIDLTNAAIVEPTLDPGTYARNLYARLRMLDTQGLDAIYVELPPDAPEWRAVRDRLLRATKPLR